MRLFIYLFPIFFLAACSKPLNEDPDPFKKPDTELNTVYPVTLLDSISEINKTTSWYTTNRSFDQLFDIFQTPFRGFELLNTGKIIFFVTGTWSSDKSYYWPDLGTYLYTDLTGDNKKDLWAYYYKSPWPTNQQGLHLFYESESRSKEYNLQIGLTQVRKCVLSDMNNDNSYEVVLFSSGFDGPPGPGDSLGIFYVNERKYQYLVNDIGYFHGGATGDINNDGLIDIVAFSGASSIIPTHPAAYLNRGNRIFELSNHIFSGFTEDQDNYYTVELFDIDNDSDLDLFFGGVNNLIIIKNSDGHYERSNAISLPLEIGLDVIDIAFLDFNNDKKIDILTMNVRSGYQGYALRLFMNKGENFEDGTKTYFDYTDEMGKDSWIKWIRLFDYDQDGDIDIVADGLFGDLGGTVGKRIYWRNKSGKFFCIHEEPDM